jgi:hypothetical protein
VDLAGSYKLDEDDLDFHGTLKLVAKYHRPCRLEADSAQADRPDLCENGQGRLCGFR